MKTKDALISKSYHDFTVSILPEIELYSGILTQTSWTQIMKPYNQGNLYYRDLQKYFSKYSDSQAISTINMAQMNGLEFDKVIHFLLNYRMYRETLGQITWDDSLVERVASKDVLDHARQAVEWFEQNTDFYSFLATYQPMLEMVLDNALSKFNYELVINWLYSFYGSDAGANEFYLILAPGMLPGGGYATTICKDGIKRYYQTIMEDGFSNDLPVISSGIPLELLSLHEWGHAFVNPAFDQYVGLAIELGLEKFFTPVKTVMTAQAYGDYRHFFHEQILRSICALVANELYGEAKCHEIIDAEESRGFYLTEFTIQCIKDYNKNRDRYPRFIDFMPIMLQQYSDHFEELILLAK